MKVLVLGGYGTFGGRLVALLADMDGLHVLVAGRDGARAAQFCGAGLRRIHAGPVAARLEPVVCDRRHIAEVLARQRPDLVVDASGPFQAYGDPYAVPRACLAVGADYLDLADGADFVAGIGALDAQARAAGRFVLAGVSSFPVLSAAVLTEMQREMAVTGLWGGIAPSPFAGVGRNVLRAVLGYGGAPVTILRSGDRAVEHALVASRRAVVAPPGAVPLRRLRFSLVDVPDLAALPVAFPGLRDLWIGAAPQPPFWHGMLTGLAAIRAAWRLPRLTPLAPLAEWVLNRLTWGEDRGGMILVADGRRDGAPARLEWHLLAEGRDGPLIPSMAAEGIIRALAAGQRPDPGARSGIGALSLADYQRLFAGRAITTGWRRDDGDALYPRLLGAAFDTLPEPLRRLHRPGGRAVWSGQAEITRGSGPAARAVAGLFGFPEAGRQVPVTVTLTTDANGRETWTRSFAGRTMRSTQEAGRGARRHLLVERFGPFAFAMAVTCQDRTLRLVPRGWRLWGLPLPRGLMPGGPASEAGQDRADQARSGPDHADYVPSDQDGRFHFDVAIKAPLIGPIVHYRGWLTPDPAPPSQDRPP